MSRVSGHRQLGSKVHLTDSIWENNRLALDLNTQIAPGQIIVSQEHQIDQEQESILKVGILEVKFNPEKGTRK